MSILKQYYNNGKIAFTEQYKAKLEVLNMSPKTKIKSKSVPIKATSVHHGHYDEMLISFAGITPYLNDDKSFKSYKQLDKETQVQLDEELWSKKVASATIWLEIDVRNQSMSRLVPPKNSTIERNFMRESLNGTFTVKQKELAEEIYTNLSK